MNAQLAALAKSHGIILPPGADYLSPEFAQDCALAFDAQPSLITVSNSGYVAGSCLIVAGAAGDLPISPSSRV